MACCKPLAQDSFNDGFSKLAAGFAGLVQAFLELVAKGHKLINVLDDAVLQQVVADTPDGKGILLSIADTARLVSWALKAQAYDTQPT